MNVSLFQSVNLALVQVISPGCMPLDGTSGGHTRRQDRVLRLLGSVRLRGRQLSYQYRVSLSCRLHFKIQYTENDIAKEMMIDRV